MVYQEIKRYGEHMRVVFSVAVRRNEIGEQESRTGMNNSERKNVAFCIHW